MHPARPDDGAPSGLTADAANDWHDVTVTVRDDGALTEVPLQRWRPLGSGSYRLQPFAATLDGLPPRSTVTRSRGNR